MRRRLGIGLGCVAIVLLGACSSATGADGNGATSATSGTSTASSVVPSASLGTTSTTPPTPPPAPARPAYDNTRATQACTLLAPSEVAAAVGAAAGAPTPLDPYCQWRVGDDGFVALTVWNKPLAQVRAYPGLAVANQPDLGDGAFWGSNKQLFFGMGATTYSLQFQRGAEWVDSNRPKLQAMAQVVLDRLGFVPPPPPPEPVTTVSLPPPTPPVAPPDPGGEGEVSTTAAPAPPATTPPPTTVPAPTTTRPKPPPVAPVAPVVPPTNLIDTRRQLTGDRPLRIWAGGDSIAGGPAWAIGQAARATGLASADTEFQVGTGLARPDFFDWPAHLAAVADARDPDVMVLLFGGNDIQPLDLPGGGAVGWGDARWLDEYRRRVAAIMDTLAVRGRHVVWVGLPPMSEPGYSQQMVALNEIFASEAARRSPWVAFVPTWDTFSPPGEPGVFTRDLPGPDGQPLRVRFDDIHFNVPGSERVAAMVMRAVSTFTTIPPA